MTDRTTLEIERRFVLATVSRELRQRAQRVHDIRQAYLSLGRPAIRVRESSGQYRMTVKDGAGLVRREVEFEIGGDVAEALFEIGRDRTITKTRYEFGRWEIDVFEGRFKGLLIAEVELRAEDEPLPDFPAGVEVLCEVTQLLGFTNQYLASLDEAEAQDLVTELLRDHEGTLEALERRRAQEGG